MNYNLIQQLFTEHLLFAREWSRFWVHGPSLCDHPTGLASQVGSWFEENALFIDGHSVSLGVWPSVTLTVVERVIEWMNG